MSRQHYTRLLKLWPVDRLRPAERHFQRLLESRIQDPPSPFREEVGEVNAAYVLLDGSIGKQFSLSERMMAPASDPHHYTRLEREINEVPERGFWGRLAKRLGGMVRMK